MFKYLNPKRFYYAVGKKKFLEFILLAVFMLFFYGPLMYMCITAFGNVYEVPNIFPTEWGFKWWNFVFSQKSLVSSIVQSLTIAVITTVCCASRRLILWPGSASPAERFSCFLSC